MKNKNIIVGLSLFLMVVLAACTEKQAFNGQSTSGLPVFATLDTRSLPEGLGCELFIFWKLATETDYIFKQSIDLTSGQLPRQMEFSYKDILHKQYRFLFVAQPVEATNMVVSNNGSTLAAGDKWTDLRIETTQQGLGTEYYYGILDKNGEEIIESAHIQGELSRIVGQMALDIFRIEENIDQPVDVQSKHIASVIDRVHTIEIEYFNLTKSIAFDVEGNILESENWETSYKQIIQPAYGDTLQVELPQSDIGLLAGEKKGSVRIKGICGIASSPKIRVKYIFKYYDTTALCERNHAGEHQTACYTSDNLITLNLPGETDTNNLLSIQPGYITLNKAGIRLDRIIDINHTTPYVFETTWANVNAYK